MRRVLADTGPLYALADRDDQYHSRARGEARRLAREHLEVVVCYPIVLESYTLVLHRLSGPVAERWLGEVMARSGLVNPHPGDYQRAAERLQRFQDQGITLFDAVLAVLAESLDLPVWTFDHHFDSMQVRVWR